ncbi:hypothetical protein [Chitinophaga sp. MD30]|uniref:hypothetical protein n=1 Tax=Chitinophaga sp. MD30 TaxID=2033437 RepID=UPI000BAF2A96|nr:hypothetical protein [Chitinophaga sp. MD30]ASZ13082.1 hypothetical protein CK934_20015 [Chitinophaga sp. MD30]
MGVILFFTLTVLLARVQAQSPYAANKIIPPTPTAASIGTYGNLKVGTYTGVPVINIPIYEIKSRDNSLSIQLDYSATGVKVAQEAGWAGLGWNLSAGGAITRIVRGIPDFTKTNNAGYYYASRFPPSVYQEPIPLGPNPTGERAYFDAISRGEVDGEPDIFNYNFGPFSGSFVLGKRIDGGPVYLNEQNNLEIKYQEGTWVIKDGNGYSYYFSSAEYSKDYYSTSLYSEVPDNADLSYFIADVQKDDITTAWYLDSIVSAAGNTMKFEYIKSESLSRVGKNESVYYTYPQWDCTAGSLSPPPMQWTYAASRQLNTDIYLKKITFDNGQIEFETAPRDDIEARTADKRPQRLTAITAKDRNGLLLKKFQFYHSYFNQDNFNALEKRLRLDSVVEIGQGNLRKPAYVLNYFGNTLPSKVSKAIDHWGFYNGNTSNSTLIPKVFQATSGAVRTPAKDSSLVLPGTLTWVKYPTGGSTNFEYELNEYGNLILDDAYDVISKFQIIRANPVDHYDQVTKFELLETDIPSDDPYALVPLKLNYGYSEINCQTCELRFTQKSFVAIRNSKGAIVKSYNSEMKQGGINEIVEVRLPPGKYQLELSYTQEYSMFASVGWESKVKVDSRKGGGIRIKSITDSTVEGISFVKKYDYTDAGKSSGKLLTPFRYSGFYTMVNNGYHQGGPEPRCSYYGLYGYATSTTQYPQGLGASGGIVGYSKVTEILGAIGQGGKTEFQYINVGGLSSDVNYPGMPFRRNSTDGRPIQILTYDKDGNILKKINYSYNIENTAKMVGVVLNSIPRSMQEDFAVKRYDNYSEWVTQAWEETTQYASTGTIVSKKTSNYGNIDHKQVTREETEMSDGSLTINRYKYPSDFTDAADVSFVRQMKNRHIIEPAIEQSSLVIRNGNKKLVDGQFTTFVPVNNVYKPALIYKTRIETPLTDTSTSNITAANQLILNSAYTPELYFDNYDLIGNLQQVHKANGGPEAYLYDYNMDLPIAHALNANVTDIAYTSFEADGSGNWNITGGARLTEGMTGTQSFNLSGGNIVKNNLLVSKNYYLSYWSKNGPLNISGASNKTEAGSTAKGFTFYKHKLTNLSNGTITITGAAVIDELKLYPVDSKMTTYTHIPLIGITSEISENGIIMTYEYDAFNRLRLIRDQTGQILKLIDYQIQVPVQQ